MDIILGKLALVFTCLCSFSCELVSVRRGDYCFSLPLALALTFEPFLDSSFFSSIGALVFLGSTSLAVGSDFFLAVTTGFLALVYLLASGLGLETGFASPSRSTNSINTIGASSPLR